MLSTRIHSFHSLTFLLKQLFYPNNEKYTNCKYQWIKLSKGFITIGINEKVVTHLHKNDLCLDKVDKCLKENADISKGQTLFTLHSPNGNVITFISPFKGQITEVNHQLLTQKSMIERLNKQERWIVKMKVDEYEASEVMEKLLSEEQYKSVL
jgi:glycine cleavage system H lipoate-binding protein